MKKTVLFGAGSIAAQVILYNKNLNIVAIADNDKKKAGTLFHGVSIIEAENLKNTDFDEIMITTGMVIEAKAQLTERFGIDEYSIVLPFQHLTKSLQVHGFRDNRRLVNLLLTQLSTSKIAADFGMIVDMDTLKDLAQFGHISSEASLVHLSILCHGLIPLSTFIDQELLRLSVTEKFKWQLNPMKTAHGDIIAYVLEICLEGYESRPINFIFRGYLAIEEYAVDLPSQSLFFSPLSLRNQTAIHTFGDLVCRCPENFDQYLIYMFDNWRDCNATLRLYQYRHRGLKALPMGVQKALAIRLPWMFDQPEEISIVMVVYNNIDYLKESIESVILQLVPYRFVIHCVDDASDDGSTELLRQYQQKFSNSVVMYDSNLNQGSGKKSLLTHRPDIKGNFWGFLSGDDFWLTHFNLWYQTNYLLDSPSAVACSCSTIMRDELTNFETIIAPQRSRWNLLDLLLLRKKIRFYTHTSSILWRNIFYTERRFFLPAKFELPESLGDVMLAHFMLEKGGEIHMMQRVMNFYRYSGKGVWSSKTKEEQRTINEKLHTTIYNMISVKHKILCEIYRSKMIPNGIKRIFKGPINE